MLDIPYTRHELSNGLRVVLSPDPTIPVVGVNLWYGVGSRNERPGRTGFAHLFEHMMFQGSANVPKGSHFELVERAGGSLNASTWFDRTNYFETVPAHQLELALWLEADRMGWMLPALTQEKLDNQRDVVKNEKRQRYDNQPYGDWSERIQKLVFPEGHPYRHTVIGSMEDLDAASLEDVEEFFRTYYVPNNAVLTICGDLDEDHALELVERQFGEIPAGPPPPPVPGTGDLEPVIGETRRERVESDVPLPRVYFAARVPPYDTEGYYEADVASGVLGNGKASRLYRSLVREQQVAKDVVSFTFPLLTGATMLLLWVTGYPDADPEELERALVAEVEGLDSAREEELERSLAINETEMLRQIEKVGDRADLLSMFEIFFDDPGRINSEIDRYRSVDVERLRSFADRYLGEDNRVIVSYVPGGES
ncbi:MAG: pitrilysin family protein [Longimicrobiales bacterium]|nr:pitrilysin family protein [Longimicrobiales bacterium]